MDRLKMPITDDPRSEIRGLRRRRLGIKPRATRPAGTARNRGAETAGPKTTDVTEILGQPVYRKVADVPGSIDCVDVFRRPQDLMPHLDDLIAARPSVVWLQAWIRHDDFARALAEQGIRVVQDRCLMVDHRRAMSG
jgi:hypothetical protein